DIYCFRRLHTSLRRIPQTLAQGLALDVLGHYIAQVPVFRLRLADLVYRDDVRVVKRARDARLPRKALHAISVGRERGRQELEGDFPSEPRVEREMYFAHPAPPERLDQFVGADLRPRD